MSLTKTKKEAPRCEARGFFRGACGWLGNLLERYQLRFRRADVLKGQTASFEVSTEVADDIVVAFSAAKYVEPIGGCVAMIGHFERPLFGCGIGDFVLHIYYHIMVTMSSCGLVHSTLKCNTL